MSDNNGDTLSSGLSYFIPNGDTFIRTLEAQVHLVSKEIHNCIETTFKWLASRLLCIKLH